MGWIRRCRSSYTPWPRLYRLIKPAILVLLLVYLLTAHYAIYRIYTVVAGVTSAKDLDEMAQRLPALQSLVQNGGLVPLKADTLDRLFLLSHTVPRSMRAQPHEYQSSPEVISFLGVDVSHSGEASYIYKRILQRLDFNYSQLVIDVGANDGFLSSNSYNFIQWGWHAILVEPLPDQIKKAKDNLVSVHDPYWDEKQLVYYVHGTIGKTDGQVDFVLPSAASGKRGYVLEGQDQETRSKFRLGLDKIKVHSYTVRSFVERYKVPRYFGILSINTEGTGEMILNQWLELGFRPAYIIYEFLHQSEPKRTADQVANRGYKLIAKRGWNLIFEHRIS